MKKLSALLLALALCFSLSACFGGASSTPDASSPASTPAEPMLEGTLTEIMDKVIAGVPAEDMPMMMLGEGDDKYVKLDSENSEYYVGVTASDYKEGIAADAAISAVAHSVCLLRAEDAASAEALMTQVSEKANPRKWICVEAESVIVNRIGDVVILIMSTEDTAAKLNTSFEALA